MDSISICGYQMDEAFGFYLPEYEDASPQIQSNFVEIQGMNGSLDLTEQDGIVYYNDIIETITLEKVTKELSIIDLKPTSRELNNALLGKAGEIIFDDDNEFYRYGRVLSINLTCKDNGKLVAKIKLRLHPYRYKTDMTIVSRTVSGNDTITLSNLNMPVLPVVSVTSEMVLRYVIRGNEYTVTVSAGEHRIDSLILFEGDTIVEVTGEGTITFQYREGSK